MVSNPSAPIPVGIQQVSGFVSLEDEAQIDAEIDDNLYWKEGFDVRRRVQRFRLTEVNAEIDATATASTDKKCRPRADAPPSLLRLSDRLREETGLVAQFVSIEEIPVAGSQGMRNGEFASEHVVTTFDSTPFDNDDKSDHELFVACVPIGRSVVQHLNRPSRRSASCWRLESPNHWFDVRINRGCLHLRQQESLQSWRSCFVASLDEDETRRKNVKFNGASTCDTIRVVTFCALPPSGGEREQDKQEKGATRNAEDPDWFGYCPDVDDDARGSHPMPPLPDHLTIVITTSPIRSNPSTELLEKAMGSFALGGIDFAYRCRKVIVCGTCRMSHSCCTHRRAFILLNVL